MTPDEFQLHIIDRLASMETKVESIQTEIREFKSVNQREHQEVTEALEESVTSLRDRVRANETAITRVTTLGLVLVIVVPIVLEVGLTRLWLNPSNPSAEVST